MSETRLRQLCRDLNVPQIPDRVHRRMQLGIEELTRDEEEACTAAIKQATALLRPHKVPWGGRMDWESLASDE
jgi:hypothetical protein